MAEPRKTPLYDNHVALGGKIVDFAGWLLPVQYEGILAEHKHCRAKTALFDTCHMGQVLITGPGAAEAISSAITQNANALPIGRGKYGFILNEIGGVIDDTILMRLAEDEFLLVVNAGTQDNDVAMLRERFVANIPSAGKAEIIHQTDWGKLDVQGPGSFETLKSITECDLASLKYFGVTRAEIQGCDCIIGRTGYTGELGYEIFMPAEALPNLFETLLQQPDVKPAGLGARDSLRLEMAYPLFGHELSEEINPIEADLAMFIDPFGPGVGSEALRKIAGSCPVRKLVAIASPGRRQFHPGDEILAENKAIGQVTSGAFSPSLNVAIGMGFVQAEFANIDTELTIRTARAEIPARVTDKPFYKNGTSRKQLH